MNNSDKLKILYHHRTQGRGAEGVHITSIVRALQMRGHEVTVLSPPGIDPMKNAGNAPVDKSNVETTGVNSLWKFISMNLPNFMFEFAEVFYNLPAIRRLNNELSKTHYDLIYERYAFYMFAGAICARKYGIPFVLEANEVNGIKERARKQSFPKLCRIFEKYIFNQCTSIHTVSSYLKQLIIKHGIAESTIVVTPNAIDPNKFTGIIDSSDLIKTYNLEGKVVIGFAGWFDNWDRLDLLINVFINLKKDYSNIILLLIGDGKVLQLVRDKAKTANVESSVILTGSIKRDVVHKYLSLLNIAIITHSNEFGSPVVMFEFMGLKIPIVAPRLMPITDVMVDKESALLFNVMDMTAMESCVRTLLDNPKLAEYIASNAYSKLMRDHTWDNNAHEIVMALT